MLLGGLLAIVIIGWAFVVIIRGPAAAPLRHHDHPSHANPGLRQPPQPARVRKVHGRRPRGHAARGAPTPIIAARAFANAYLRHLDGEQARVPYATLTSRAQAGADVPAGIPKLHLAGLRRLGSTALSTAIIATGEGAGRDYPFTMDVTRGGEGWYVTGLEPPDFPQDRRHRESHPTAGPPSSARVAARTFALAYADYAMGATRRLPHGSKIIRRQILAGGDPLAGLPPNHRSGRLESVQFGPSQSGRFAVEAVVRAGRETLTFWFLLAHTQTGWVAVEFPGG